MHTVKRCSLHHIKFTTATQNYSVLTIIFTISAAATADTSTMSTLVLGIFNLHGDFLQTFFMSSIHMHRYSDNTGLAMLACSMASGTAVLASCLIYAKPFRHPFRGNRAPILVLIWVRSFIEPNVLKTKVPFDNTAQIYLINLHWKLGLRFKLRLGLHYFSIFTENKKSEHLIFREFHGL